MHAVSDDLLNWQKIPADTFYAPEGLYEPHDWRDPFVFFEPESQRYWMLLAARSTTGLARRRGCIALCTSKDLTTWCPEQPFWAPHLYITHECPDLFRIGDWWYLVYSEFSERFTTRYRMSRQLSGPWIASAEDALDGRAYYAAKTAGDDGHRYAFGWIATRMGEADGGDWQWAGQLAVHEIVQQPDGALTVNLPGTIRSAFSKVIVAALLPSAGDWETCPGQLTASAPDSFATALGPDLPQQCLISTTITFAAGTRGCGVLLRAAGDAGYYIRLEPQRGRLVFDRWPRQPEGSFQWQIAGDVPHALELERVVELEAGKPHSLEILIDGAICIVYLDGIVAMSARIYDRSDGRWGLFASEGVVEFKDFAVRTM
jgi:beta-fructofuranosidase